jgi:GTPase SAR1 family protein
METATILVLGERNVGKTSYIRKMTRDSPNNKIDEIMSNELDQIGIQRAIHESILSNDVINFMVYYGNKVFLNSDSIHIPNNMLLPAINFEDTENGFVDLFDNMEPTLNANTLDTKPLDANTLDANTLDEKSTNKKDLSKYTKIILMCDFTDITTMRSMLCYISKYDLTNKNTIICVNKCDYDTTYDDIQLNRIYRVLKDFNVYPVEFISTNTGFNLEFIYKYI